jgi:hypothetical protein
MVILKQLQHIFVEVLINFEYFMSKIEYLKIFYIFLHKILFFEIFKKITSNILNVEAIKVPWQFTFFFQKVVMTINPLALKKKIAPKFLLN